MATSQQRTRKQIRQSVGLITGLLWQDGGVESSPSEPSPSAGKIIDQNLAFGSEDEHRGKWIFATNSVGFNRQRRVSASSPSERSLDLSVALDAAPDTAWTYELWSPEISPTTIHDFMAQSITEATRKGSVPLTSDSLHTGGGVHAWPLSSGINGVRYVEWRRSFVGEQVFSFDDETTSSSINAFTSLDSEDVKEGSAAGVVTVTSSFSTLATAATITFPSVNMRGYTDLEFWVKSNVDQTSSNWRFVLRDSTPATLEVLTLPALNADSWTRVNLSLTNPESDSDVVAIFIQTGSSDGGSATLLFDDLITYRARAEEWVYIPREFWRIDKDRRELRIDPDAGVPYARLQVTGVQKPALLTLTDSQVSQIDPQYVVNATAAKVFRTLGNDAQSDRFEALAQQQRNRMTTPSGIRWVDD